MKNPVWITRELLTAIHDRQQAEHGGTPGVSDPMALASALEEPKRRFAEEKMSLTRIAAAYAVSLCVGRPFHDNNNQTAAVVCSTFLTLNGLGPVPADGEFFDAMNGLASAEWDEAAFDRWLCGQRPELSAGLVTGRKIMSNRSPIMFPQYQCPRCGGTEAEPGSIQTTGSVHFRPANAKFLTLKTANVEVKANACTNCGHVDLVADVTKLAALTARVQPV